MRMVATKDNIRKLSIFKLSAPIASLNNYLAIQDNLAGSHQSLRDWTNGHGPFVESPSGALSYLNNTDTSGGFLSKLFACPTAKIGTSFSVPLDGSMLGRRIYLM